MKFIDLNKKKNRMGILGAGITGMILLIIFVYIPFIYNQQRLSLEAKKVDRDIRFVQNFLQSEKKSPVSGELIHEHQMVMAIDEITRAGQAFNIKFVSIYPKDKERIEQESFSRLPIEISMISGYTELGKFLSAIHELKKVIITVKSFHIQRDEDILPLIRSTLIFEVYLKNE